MPVPAANELRRDLFSAATAYARAGVPIAMVRLEWDGARGKKRLARNPPAEWHRRPILNAAQVESAIRSGCNAYLYRLPEGVWVLDSDTAESVTWATRFGPPVTITPRGEHRLFAGPARAVLPAGIPETSSDLAVRQLYGPGSFYDTPSGTVVYRGGPGGLVTDLTAVPPMPAELTGAAPSNVVPFPGITDTTLSDSITKTERIPSVSSPPAPVDDFFAPAAMTQDQARQRTAAMLNTIRTGPKTGERARAGIRDVALFLGGLLHTGWFTAETATAEIERACADRWGSASDADRTWIAQGLADGQRPGKALRVREGSDAPGKAGEPSGASLKLVSAAGASMRVARWLWVHEGDNRIPLGEITLFGGRGNVGKSPATLWLAATVSRGLLPGDLLGTPRDVIVYASEDSWETTIVPRLHAAGADVSRVHFIAATTTEGGEERDFSWAGDLGLLEVATAERRAALLIIDPILDILPGGASANDSNDVSKALRGLIGLAQRAELAVVGVAHTRKTDDGHLDNLLSGAAAWRNKVRAVFIFAVNKSTGHRILEQNKNNLGRSELPILRFDIESVDVAIGTARVSHPRFVLAGTSEYGVLEALSARDQTSAPEPDEDLEWVAEELKKGQLPTTTLATLAEGRGLKWDTFKRKMTKSGLFATHRQGFGANGGWFWELTRRGYDAYSGLFDDYTTYTESNRDGSGTGGSRDTYPD